MCYCKQIRPSCVCAYTTLSAISPHFHALSVAKKQKILENLLKLMPIENRAFWKELPSNDKSKEYVGKYREVLNKHKIALCVCALYYKHTKSPFCFTIAFCAYAAILVNYKIAFLGKFSNPDFGVKNELFQNQILHVLQVLYKHSESVKISNRPSERNRL